MGFKTADMPPVDPAEFDTLPFMDRMKLLAIHWCEYGFGSPKQIHMLYVYKLLVYAVLGLTLVWATTPGLGGITDIGSWWAEPIVYQKLMVWTIAFEILGLSSSSGPLAFRFSPMIGGVLYWTKIGTLRAPPWPEKVPLTGGDHRTVWDITIYYLLLLNVAFLLFMPGVQAADWPGEAGLMNPIPIATYLVLLVIMGLRDKVVFLASRAEQYMPALFFFAVFGFVDMIVAVKIAMIIIWMGAGVSKFGRHTTNVVAPMLSNTPWITSLRFKRSLYRNFPTDIRPSKISSAFTHLGGTVVELALPLILLFSTNTTITLLAILGMVVFHLVITSMFPLAVPLEWNVFFMFTVGFLFWNFPAGDGDGYGVGDMSSPWLLAAVLAGLLFFPILGNLRPDLVSFLPSMRQYAGNWASATWAFRGDGEKLLNEHIIKASTNQVDQLTAAYGPEVAEIFMQKAMAWRTMHSQGRGLVSLMMRHLDKMENYSIREGEFTCSTLLGWQFGDAHLHDERLINAVQKRCNFAPGELIIVHVESQPIHKLTQAYRVIDAALGVVERGTYVVKDATDEQPWLPNGPIPHQVTWTAPGYTAPGMHTKVTV